MIKDFARKHPDSAGTLSAWLKLTGSAVRNNLAQVRGTYPHADQVIVASGRPVVVFNIAGNKYRLVAAVHYNTGLVFLLSILTHSEYSKDIWKRRL